MSQYGDGDCASVYDEETRKARKPHKCGACREAIPPGQVYHRTFIVFDGEPEVFLRCARCQVIYEHLSKRIRDEGAYEEFCDLRLNCGHTYEDRWQEAPPAWLAALAFWRPGDPLPELP